MKLVPSIVDAVNNGSSTRIAVDSYGRGAIELRPFVTMVDWLSVNATGPFWAVKLPVGDWAPWHGLNMRRGR